MSKGKAVLKDAKSVSEIVKKQEKLLKESVKGTGRSGKQKRLKEMMTDDKLGKSDRGLVEK